MGGSFGIRLRWAPAQWEVTRHPLGYEALVCYEARVDVLTEGRAFEAFPGTEPARFDRGDISRG